MLIAILAAVAAGACFAMGGVLQQRIASSLPDRESLSLRLLRDLATQPVWLAGIGLAVLSYGFQGLALAWGPLALVQPLIVTELIFALPVAARLRGLRLGWRSWTGAVAVGGGLAVAIVSAAPEAGRRSATVTGWFLLLIAVAGLVAVAVLVGRRVAGPPRASLFALAGASVLGAQSALFAITVTHLQEGIVPLFTAWQTYLLVAASIGGLLLVQSAYQAGPLAASMPVVDSVELVVAVTIGVALFDEQIAEGTLRRLVAVVALACVIGGIVMLDTSPVTRRLYRQERRQQQRQRG